LGKLVSPKICVGQFNHQNYIGTRCKPNSLSVGSRPAWARGWEWDGGLHARSWRIRGDGARLGRRRRAVSGRPAWARGWGQDGTRLADGRLGHVAGVGGWRQRLDVLGGGGSGKEDRVLVGWYLGHHFCAPTGPINCTCFLWRLTA
jgi:hypothetical protein